MATAALAHAEPHAGGHYTSTGLSSNKIAIWAFIGSEWLAGRGGRNHRVIQ